MIEKGKGMVFYKEDYIIETEKQNLNVITINERNSAIACGGCSSFFIIRDPECCCFQDTQRIPLTEGYLTAATFMYKPKENRLITGFSDGYIKIWRRNGRGIYYCKYSLKHERKVNALVVNKNNDLIISGSKDRKIILWRYIEQDERGWEYFKTLNFHQDSVVQISLSKSETQLISCGLDKAIILYSLDKFCCKKRQRIFIEHHAFSVCFLYENMFAIKQVQGCWGLIIFKRNEYSKQFTIFRQFYPRDPQEMRIYDPPPFPLIFNQDNRILIYKEGRELHIIRVKQEYQEGDWNFTNEQIIQFRTGKIYGTMVKEYLITFDNVSTNLQRRKLCWREKK